MHPTTEFRLIRVGKIEFRAGLWPSLAAAATLTFAVAIIYVVVNVRTQP